MKQSFPYIPPATDSQQVYTDGETMDEAVEAFENHDYLKSLQLLIDALDCDFRERYGNPEGTSFRIPHGSIVVRINITPKHSISRPISCVCPKRGAWPCCARSRK